MFAFFSDPTGVVVAIVEGLGLILAAVLALKIASIVANVLIALGALWLEHVVYHVVPILEAREFEHTQGPTPRTDALLKKIQE